MIINRKSDPVRPLYPVPHLRFRLAAASVTQPSLSCFYLILSFILTDDHEFDSVTEVPC